MATEHGISGIYILRLSDTHYYGGRSKDIGARVEQHIYTLRLGVGCNIHMKRVWDAHQRMDVEVLHHVPPERLIEAEQKWLDEHIGMPGCLNFQRDAAYGGPPPCSPTTRDKLRAAGRKGTGSSPARKAAGEARRGVFKHGPEAIAKMRAASTGRIHSEATKAKMRTSLLGQKRPYQVGLMKGNKYAYGRSPSPETRLKMSESIRRARALTDPARAARGAAIHTARLSEGDVLEIRRRSADGETRKALAIEYCVSPPNISSIVLHHTWKHIP